MNPQPLPGFQQSLMGEEIFRFENITEGDPHPFLCKAFLFSFGSDCRALTFQRKEERGWRETASKYLKDKRITDSLKCLPPKKKKKNPERGWQNED